jgi:hypothetical protein
MMIASGFFWTAALMIGICVDAPASVGPEIVFVPPSSFSASPAGNYDREHVQSAARLSRPREPTAASLGA